MSLEPPFAPTPILQWREFWNEVKVCSHTCVRKLPEKLPIIMTKMIPRKIVRSQPNLRSWSFTQKQQQFGKNKNNQCKLLTRFKSYELYAIVTTTGNMNYSKIALDVELDNCLTCSVLRLQYLNIGGVLLNQLAHSICNKVAC